MARPAQEGSWKWFLSIISVPVSWLVAAVVSSFYRPVEDAEPEPWNGQYVCWHEGPVPSGHTDCKKNGSNIPPEAVRSTGRRPWFLLRWRQQTPALEQWFLHIPGFLNVDWKMCKWNRFLLWGHFWAHKESWPRAPNSLWCNLAFTSCHPGPVSPPTKCQMLVKCIIGRLISGALHPWCLLSFRSFWHWNNF